MVAGKYADGDIDPRFTETVPLEGPTAPVPVNARVFSGHRRVDDVGSDANVSIEGRCPTGHADMPVSGTPSNGSIVPVYTDTEFYDAVTAGGVAIEVEGLRECVTKALVKDVCVFFATLPLGSVL